MKVDAFDVLSPSRVFVIPGEQQLLAGIIDGSGSWGSGREAADRAREQLVDLWRRAPSWSANGLARDISVVALSTPSSLRDPEFGWSFSGVCLLCADDVVTCLASGLYRVDVLSDAGTSTLFRPRMLVDELLANGTLDVETAVSFPHPNVCIEPLVGDKETVSLTTTRHQLFAGEVLVVTHAVRFDIVGMRPPTSAAALRWGVTRKHPSQFICFSSRRFSRGRTARCVPSASAAAPERKRASLIQFSFAR